MRYGVITKSNNLTDMNGLEPVYEYEPQVTNYNQKKKIIFYTTSQERLTILIDPNKTMEELIKFFFEKAQRPDSFGDPDIRFIMNSKLILNDSKELINNYINPFNKTNIIIVDDVENKIQGVRKIEIDFVNDNQGNVQVFIDPNKTVAELIKLYFETMKRPG